LYHGLPASSSPHRPVDSHPHPPLSSLRNGSFGDRENAFSYTIKDIVREGDTLVVWRLDRLGRSIKDLIEWVNWLEQEGAGLKSLQEAIDTTSTGGKLTFHIFAALAEFEQQLIQERTQAGLNAARARGRLGGRPKALSASKQKRAVELYQEKQLAVQEICKIMGISKPTLYAYVRQAQSAT
jgi:DNA invertase Pin-like site-specific DNA recombinase